MFLTLKTEIEGRFRDLESLFKGTIDLKGQHQAALKGLMFVQIYAVYEYTVKSVVNEVIESMKSHRHMLVDLSPSMMALFLDPEWNSFRDSGKKKEWENRLRIFERAFSKDRVNLSSDTSLPNDGSHYRYTHLQMIFRVFGIRRSVVRRKEHIQRISEVVGHRNAIAHGEEKAEDVGRRYTRSEIVKMIRQMKSVCLLQISVFDEFCADKGRYLRK